MQYNLESEAEVEFFREDMRRLVLEFGNKAKMMASDVREARSYFAHMFFAFRLYLLVSDASRALEIFIQVCDEVREQLLANSRAVSEDFIDGVYTMLSNIVGHSSVAERYIAMSDEEFMAALCRSYDVLGIGDIVTDPEQALKRFIDIGFMVRAEVRAAKEGLAF